MALTFRSLGRSRHPVLGDAQALRALVDLEDALWVATAAPTATLVADPVLLASLDTDGDGRIRSDELRAGIRWMLGCLANTSGVREGNESLELAHLAADGDGAALRDAARRVLGALGDPGGATVSLAQVRQVRADEEKRGLSAAGRVLPAAAAGDASIEALIRAAIDATGGVPHPSGEVALDGPSFDGFLEAARAWLAWHDEGSSAEIRPAGEGTAAASLALAALAPKLDQYFLLCDAIRLDADLAAHAKVDPTGTDLLDAEAATALLSRAPLAPPRADGVLDLDGALNPAWSDAVRALREQAVVPLLGDRTTLDRAAVGALGGAVRPWRDWIAREPKSAAGDAGADPLRGLLADEAGHARVKALIAESEVAAVVLDGVKQLERLILFQGGMLPVANSFAAMPDVFDAGRRAMFEQGTLIMDGRRFELAVRVTDAARAEKFAAMSPMFTMFVMVGEKGTAWEFEVAVPVTAGERGHLVEGMWGIFIDRKGRELHAQVRKIAVSPISIKEALLSPFRRIGDAVQGMFDKAAASQQEAVGAKTTGMAQGAVDQAISAPTQLAAQGEAAKAAAAAPVAAAPVAAAPGAAAAPAGGPGMGGQLPMLIAGGGVAVAALGGMLAYVMEMFWSGAAAVAGAILSLPLLDALGPGVTTVVQILAFPVAVLILLLGVVLVPALLYAIPVTIATWLRLRRRDMASLLEGVGWAVNTRLYLERPLANQLTVRPPAPK